MKNTHNILKSTDEAHNLANKLNLEASLRAERLGTTIADEVKHILEETPYPEFDTGDIYGINLKNNKNQIKILDEIKDFSPKKIQKIPGINYSNNNKNN